MKISINYIVVFISLVLTANTHKFVTILARIIDGGEIMEATRHPLRRGYHALVRLSSLEPQWIIVFVKLGPLTY